MKKTILLLVAVTFATAAFSQNVVGLRFGIDNSFESGSTLLLGPGATFQLPLSENLVGGVNLDYHFGSTLGVNLTSINIEPRVDYYFDEVFNGAHVGTNVQLNLMSASAGGASQSAKALNLGLNFGYAHNLSDKLLLDVAVGFGNNMSLETGGGSSFIARPALTLGYKLGGDK